MFAICLALTHPNIIQAVVLWPELYQYANHARPYYVPICGFGLNTVFAVVLKQ